MTQQFTLDDLADVILDVEGVDAATLNAIYCHVRDTLAQRATLIPSLFPDAQPMQAALLGPTFRPSNNAKLSIYQQTIMQHLATTNNGDLLIAAVAGSGKTSTLVEIARGIEGDAVFLAFNKHIQVELQQRLKDYPNVTVQTGHGVGFAMLQQRLKGKVKLEQYKYSNVCRQLVRQRLPHEERAIQDLYCDALVDLANYSRLTLTDERNPQALLAMVNHYGLEDDEDIVEELLAWLPEVFARGEAVAVEQKIVDFTDMLWLPHRWQLTPKQVPWVLLDECQDISASMLALALKSRAPGGRMIFVGDEHQAINGFAGADSESIPRIVARTQARRFPLSICYRCPANHVALAQKYVPEMEARLDAPEGLVEHIAENKLAVALQPDDLILCRLTAPLITLAFALIRAGLSVTVRGREIGKGLCSVIRSVERLPGFRFSEFGKFLTEYERLQVEKLSQRQDSAARIEGLRDRVEAVRVCFEREPSTTVTQLCERIEALFDQANAKVTLSTVHRAKGSQAQRVFLFKPDKMPLTWNGQQDWEKQQEANISYVALTRATQALFFID